MSKLDYPRKAAALFRKAVNTEGGVNERSVNTLMTRAAFEAEAEPVIKAAMGKFLRGSDRHKPGYMAEYMRKRRAKK